MESRIHAIWKPVGQLQLVDLDNNYFLVRFTDEKDFNKVLTNGPWVIFDSHMTVQPWSRSFKTSEKYPSHVIVWLRLQALFRRIASFIGRVVKIDYNINGGECGKFERLAILLDLNKPVLSSSINGNLQRLEYDGLQQVCFKFGVYGHAKDHCGRSMAKIGNSEGDKNTLLESSDPNKVEDTEANLFGSWMIVDTRRRKKVVNSDATKLTMVPNVCS
ncbi:uncharacterized protein LOC120177795 [Hibiscus syriacus]|uniref:uncharacterized protein LOC120177795 n=1 Tax=Hibiscus syriacus TaxID=106335 RepID=UPI001920E5B5|nr:uncharacterized protein LOC120177795 [Hibiscus syriacus]